jgi:cytochrome c peroxidase
MTPRNLFARHLISSLALWGAFWAGNGQAQNLESLKKAALPKPQGADKYILDNNALVVLGKSLFWDMQSGSDGRTACATCHFHAGADHRAQNQLSNPLGAVAVNHLLTESDFPFHELSDITSNRSRVTRDTSSVTGSAGVLLRLFAGILPGFGFEAGSDLTGDSPFSIGGLNTRQVTGRNAPSVINAVFNYRNFWDGRASDVFTGATPFGDSDPGPHALNVATGVPVPETIRVTNSSLASQAVGPALSSAEMAYSGKSWPQMGRKMLALRPLALQNVALDDNVLGNLVDTSGRGLSPATYLDLVKAAFQPQYWNSDQLVDISGNPLGRFGSPTNAGEFRVAEFNFGLFWGLAIQAYESTLVADDSRLDRYFDGDSSALTSSEQIGLDAFQNAGNNGGQCVTCHAGAESTLASVSYLLRNGPFQTGGRAGNSGVDVGFFRTGVRPILEDAGLGGLDAFSIPLSRAVQQNRTKPSSVLGLFKTPGLRNVELTGPYMHNGGMETLEQVVAFYSRGGDFPSDGNIGPGIEQHNLTAGNQTVLVNLLKAMTDDRVRLERAPFDHPELCVPVAAQQTDAQALVPDTSNPQFTASALEQWAGIPAVGRGGNAAPLQTFEELLKGIGADGSRAHSLTEACSVTFPMPPQP